MKTKPTSKTEKEWKEAYIASQSAFVVGFVLIGFVFGGILGLGVGLMSLNAAPTIGLALLVGLFCATATFIVAAKCVQLECNSELKRMEFEVADVLSERNEEQ